MTVDVTLSPSGGMSTSSNESCGGDQAEQQMMISSQRIGDNLWKTEFVVPEMHCAGCIKKIERGLGELPNVDTVRANLSTRSVTVCWDRKKGNGVRLAKRFAELGFDYFVHENSDQLNETATEADRQLLKCLAVAGFAAANVMLLSVSVWSGADAETAQLFHLISGLIAVPTVAYSGQPFFASARKALAARRLNMDVPISLAVLLALGMSVFESLTGGEEAYFDAAVTLLFFLLIGRYLDQMMRERARDGVARLSKLSSKGAMRVGPDGKTFYIALSDITAGMILRIKPGERLPVNGMIYSGHSEIDRSLVTGESEHIDCKPGDKLEAGILNISGSIDIEATSSAQNSFLAEMAEMMKAAENGRGRFVGIADRMAQIYAPAVHLLALFTFLGWMISTGWDWHASIYSAIAVLIITCPCALGLAVPVVHVVGAQRLMKSGIMIRDGSAFERLAEVDTAVFDKTGTLTEGTPSVTGVLSPDAKRLPLIKALAARSNHPAAKAVMKWLKDEDEASVSNVSELSGKGVEANTNGKIARFGKPSWVAEISRNQNDLGQSGVAFCVAGELPTSFDLSDRLRTDAEATLRTLERKGLSLHILSGDHESAVAPVARQLSVDDYVSGVSPAEKIRYIRELQTSNKKVLMVGDGLNDAPALAEAHVSMAPGTGCDISRYSADFVFIQPSLDAVATAYQVSVKSGVLIRQNFAVALLYNSIAVPLAMAGMVTPLVAAIAMSTSSIVVIANAMRLAVSNSQPASHTVKTGMTERERVRFVQAKNVAEKAA